MRVAFAHLGVFQHELDAILVVVFEEACVHQPVEQGLETFGQSAGIATAVDGADLSGGDAHEVGHGAVRPVPVGCGFCGQPSELLAVGSRGHTRPLA